MASAASPTLFSLLLLLTISTLSATAFTDNEESLISSVAVTPAHAPSPHGHHHHSPTPSPHSPSHHHHRRHPNKTHAPTPSPTASPPASSPHHAPSPHAPLPHTPTPAPAPHHAAPPAHSPVSPPHAPSPAPSGGRYPFQRFLVAVQGVVYCKPCKYSGVDTLLGATPVLGATVKLQCNNSRVPLVFKATTDKNGYFKVKAPKTITNYGVHKCKASLVSSPDAKCSFKSTLHGGTTGGSLRVDKKFVESNQTYVMFTVGPFAFEPKCH